MEREREGGERRERHDHLGPAKGWLPAALERRWPRRRSQGAGEWRRVEVSDDGEGEEEEDGSGGVGC